ncbi:TonB-linked SusC/RagA family outer membrane protein [Chitinophaga skermanii]|uniref:TonB-linked SusC/RagA family outer membrane protein n=1 Tax=Chitinophaga skermanii TaxID=331697 RepID=A0A327QJL8_9BACT|nr:SusC/RagA family TonB-linked outer membrane protein [Chitinophaga skermanii]RAJ03924.1 TonB-linked SusC/RagA family outer membrane protein [Chitinophaga skermanii]
MRKRLIVLFLFLVALAGQAMAQSRAVKGKVTAAEDGSPIIGATVIVKGTNIGTVTNVEGVYTINVPEGNDVLVVKFVGMKDQDVKINGATVDVTLHQDVRTLNETVVTANAIKREKRSLGYSAPTVKSDELTKGQNASALNGLAGKVAGVNITSTANAPGSSSRIVLRGGSSITGNNQALIVVDGVPIDNSSVTGGSVLSNTDFGNRGNDINPDDIESMTILKGPAAAALYGSRASNGAVVITTKSGKKAKGNRKADMVFSSAVTFSNIAKLPEFQNEYGQGAGGEFDARENGSWGTKFDGQMKEWGQEINGKRLSKPYSALPNNIKNFFELGKSANNNLAISGAGDKTTYYLSLGALNSDGVLPGDYDTYNKYSVRFNGTAELSNKFSSSINVAYTKIKSDMISGGQGTGSVYNSIIQQPRDIPIDKMGDLNNPYYGYDLTKGTYGYYGSYTVSPYFLLQNYKNLNWVDRVTGNVGLTYKANDWLDVTNRLGADVYSDRRNFIAPKFSVVPVDKTTGNYKASNIRSDVGSFQEVNYNISEITNDLMVTARKKMGDFNTSVMVGHNIRQRVANTLSATTSSTGLVLPGYYNLDNSNGPITAVNSNSKRRLVGLYGALNVGYKDILFLDVTARNDWSSTLPKNNNSFFYPSVSASWIYSDLFKEAGLSHIINYGKLRASYAKVGNDADTYLIRDVYSKTSLSGGFGSTLFPFNNIPGFTVGDRVGNPNLKPETTSAYEIGTEMGLFENRIIVDFSYYKNKSKDMIISMPAASSTGYTSMVVNAGEIQNTGVELSLRGTPIKTSYGLNVELYGTFTKNNSKVTQLSVDQIVLGGYSGMSIVAARGMAYGTFYAIDVQRDPQGRVVVSPTTGMPLPTTSAVYLGSYNPDYQASLGTNINYKGWNFSMLFDTKQGGKFWSRTKSIGDFVGTAPETVVGGRDPHIYPNSVIRQADGSYKENTSVNFDPESYYGSNIQAGQHVVDASYVRLREASLSYRLPKNLLNRTPFGDITVGLFGNNLFLWTAKENVYADPEVNSGGASNAQGFDYTAQPSLRNFGFNVKVSF